MWGEDDLENGNNGGDECSVLSIESSALDTALFVKISRSH